MRKVIWLGALLLAAALLWLALRRGQAGAESLAPPAAQSTAHSEAQHPVEASAGEAAPATRQAETAPAEATAAASTSPLADGLDLRGTIVALDAQGAEHPQEDGQFELVSWKGRGGQGQTVTVRGGAWTARVARDVELGCQSIVLGGRSALLESELDGRAAHVALPADGKLALRARWLRGLRVFVRDRDTNLDLADVTLVRAEGWPRMNYPHPGEIAPKRVVVSSHSSPVVLPPQAERHLALHAGSPGHAWADLKLDGAEGGDRYLALEPGGDLEIGLDAERVDSSTVVRVRRLGVVVAELDVRDRRTLVLEGLPTGSSQVSAEIGPWWQDPIVLGKAETEIRAGERAHVQLALGAPPAAVTAALGGELRIPVEWGLERFLLVVQLLDPPLGGRDPVSYVHSTDMHKDSGRPGVWHWKVEGLQPGRYALDLFQLHYAVTVELAPAGREDVVIEVPGPCEARVRLLDKRSGTEARIDKLVWNCKRPEWMRGGGATDAQWDESQHCWRIRAPRGALDLITISNEYRQLSKTVDLREGSNEFVLELERQYSVLFHLACAGAPVSPPEICMLVLRPKEGGKEMNFWIGGGGPAFRVGFPNSGAWIVTVPEIPGYALLAPFEVLVDAEHATEQTIELVPKG